jgi:hypothetical protein
MPTATSARAVFNRSRAFLLIPWAGLLVLLLALPAISGVRGLYLNHVIATFELRGPPDDLAAQVALKPIHRHPAIRHVALTCSSWADSVWIARVQFRAAEPSEARRQIDDWLHKAPRTLSLRLVKAAYYPCRIHRPASGDILIGTPRHLDLKP